MMAAAEFEPTDTVWGSLMVACGQAGQLEAALTLWQAFKRARGGLQNVKNTEPCCAVLIACAQTYQLQPALTVLSEMKQAGETGFPAHMCMWLQVVWHVVVGCLCVESSPAAACFVCPVCVPLSCLVHSHEARVTRAVGSCVPLMLAQHGRRSGPHSQGVANCI